MNPIRIKNRPLQGSGKKQTIVGVLTQPTKQES